MQKPKMKGAAINPISFGIAFIVALLIYFVFVQRILGIQLAAVSAILFAIGLVFFGKIFGLGKTANPLTAGPSAVLGLGLIAVAILGIPGIVNLFSTTGAATNPASIGGGQTGPIGPLTAATLANSTSDCQAQIAASNNQLLGKAATVTLNPYDLEAANPFGTTVNSGTIYVFKTNNLANADNTNFLTSSASPSGATVTNLAAGDVISLAGGNASFYVETLNGACVNNERPTITVRAHSIQVPGSMSSIVYDSTGSNELGAGSNSNKYSRALSANEEQTFYWSIKNNGTYAAFWLAGVGFANGINISSVLPGGDSAALFVAQPTPDWAKNVVLNTSSESTIATTVTKDFSIYQLKSPLMLSQFKEFKTQFNIKATGSDPVGSVNTTQYSGVWGIMIDQAYARGADGKMYLDIHDHTLTKGNVGINELLVPPNRGRTGFQLDIV